MRYIWHLKFDVIVNELLQKAMPGIFSLITFDMKKAVLDFYIVTEFVMSMLFFLI